MLLLERIVGEAKILESDREKLPDGVLCRVKEPICNVEQLNANNRKYGWDVIEKVTGDKVLSEQIAKRALFGHAEHPATSQSNLELVSHVICEWVVDKATNTVYQVFDVLDTPTGRIVDCLIRAGCGVGVSTRAEGELLEEVDPDTKKKFHRVLAEKYKYITTDFTADPSTFGTIPIDVKRNVVENIKFAVSSAKSAEKQFAGAVLESMLCQHNKDVENGECNDCGCCEAIKEAAITIIADPSNGTAEVNGSVNNVSVTANSPDGGLPAPVVVTVVSQGPVHAPAPAPVVGVPDMATPEQLASVGEEGAGDDHEAQVNTTETEETEEETDHDGVGESKKSAISFMKEITQLRIDNATVTAERDRLAEAIDASHDGGLQLKVALSKIHEMRASEGVEVRALRVKLEERAAAAANTMKKLDEATATIKSLNEKVAELMVGKEQILKENKQKFESVEKSGKKALDEQVNKARLDATRAVVMEYANRKLQGFTIHDNVRALLEKCMTIAEVDEVLNDVRESTRRNALHSKPPKGITVREETRMNGDVGKRVRTVFEGLEMK